MEKLEQILQEKTELKEYQIRNITCLVQWLIFSVALTLPLAMLAIVTDTLDLSILVINYATVASWGVANFIGNL